MTLFLLLILIVNILIGLVFRERYPISLVIVTSWWYFWLLVSSLSLTGLKIPSLETYAIYLSMLLSVTIGSFAYWANSINIKSIKIGTLAPAKISNNINSRINFLINFLIFFAAPVVFYF